MKRMAHPPNKSQQKTPIVAVPTTSTAIRITPCSTISVRVKTICWSLWTTRASWRALPALEHIRHVAMPSQLNAIQPQWAWQFLHLFTVLPVRKRTPVSLAWLIKPWPAIWTRCYKPCTWRLSSGMVFTDGSQQLSNPTSRTMISMKERTYLYSCSGCFWICRRLRSALFRRMIWPSRLGGIVRMLFSNMMFRSWAELCSMHWRRCSKVGRKNFLVNTYILQFIIKPLSKKKGPVMFWRNKSI